MLPEWRDLRLAESDRSVKVLRYDSYVRQRGVWAGKVNRVLRSVRSVREYGLY